MASFKDLFNQIPLDDAYLFNLKVTVCVPSGRTEYHQQGIQRLVDGGFAVTGSGQTKGYVYFTNANCCSTNIVIVPDDLNLTDPLPFNHAGGCQVCGDYIAFGMEITSKREKSPSRIVLLDISIPAKPAHLSHLDIVRHAGIRDASNSAGAVGLARLPSCYILAVGNYQSQRIDFYTSNSLDLADTSTRFVYSGSVDKSTGLNPYENINLFAEKSADGGKVWFVGMWAHVLPSMRDYADLYEIDVSVLDKIKLGAPSISNPYHFTSTKSGARFLYGSGVSWNTDTVTMYCCEANLNGGASRCNRWP